MTALAWIILALVFVDELAAVAAAYVIGSHLPPGWLWVWLLPMVLVAVWATFASPKAPLGGRVVRPVTKVLVFSLASLGLWMVDLRGWAIALLVFSVAVNLLAELRFFRTVLPE